MKLVLAVVTMMAVMTMTAAPAAVSHDNDCWWGWFVICDEPQHNWGNNDWHDDDRDDHNRWDHRW